MYFGEFLLNRKIINEDQLLEALIYQVEHLPSFLRVLKDEKIVTAHEIVHLIQLQLEGNTDLISVLKEHKNIDDIGLGKLYQKQVINRKVLGSVLVELKFVEQTIIEKMLHEFLNDKDNLQKPKMAAGKNPENPAAAEVEISEAALESLRELGLSDEEFISNAPEIKATSNEIEPNIFVHEFLNVFNEKLNNKLNKLVKIFEQSINDGSDISNYFNSLYRDLLILKGAAMLAELIYTVEILNEWCIQIEKKLTQNDGMLVTWAQSAIPLLTQTIGCLWDLREIISRDNCERNLPNTPLLHQKYVEISTSLKSIQ
jgi:hypothetical protein